MPDNSVETPILLMSDARIQRSISRMAYQIAEDNKGKGSILVVGLKQRGYVVARKLAEAIRSVADQQVELIPLEWDESNSVFSDMPSTADGDFDYVLLVDDVIFSGRTMWAALNIISQNAEWAVLRTAALVDRGHRAVPIEATFSGMRLPTKLDEHVSVIMDNNHLKKVVLTNSGA